MMKQKCNEPKKRLMLVIVLMKKLRPVLTATIEKLSSTVMKRKIKMLKLTPYVSKHPTLMSAPPGIIEEIEKACETPEDLAELFILAYNEARSGQEIAVKYMKASTDMMSKQQDEIKDLKLQLKVVEGNLKKHQDLAEEREAEVVFQLQ